MRGLFVTSALRRKGSRLLFRLVMRAMATSFTFMAQRRAGCCGRFPTGIDVCVTVTIIDGLVLARSAFHHSMNYRSVVIFGRATLVEDREEKMAALLALSEHIIRGRWAEVREPTEQEMKATTVLSLPLEEGSAKIRTGPPLDDEEDYEMNVWAGVIPLRLWPGNR